ncbi:MAG: hypothetical protein PHI58_04815 [Candidatus Omnitrophica bacterium]|nr:hypothetical protein [Candidatus Omnitrophota bacterium]
MKYLCALLVFALVLSPAALIADCGVCDSSKSAKGALAQGKTIDVEHPTSLADEAESGVNNARLMPQSQNYDPNTGLPNVVESDKAGEL